MTPEEIVQKIMSMSETMTRPVYRGQANAKWPPESGAVRRLKETYGEDFPTDELNLQRLVDDYHRNELIMPMQLIDGTKLDGLDRLSVLQHQGAATGLLDFTEYLLAALWFACREKPKKDESEVDAKVFVLDIGNTHFALNGRLQEKPLEARQEIVYYEPAQSLGPRIIAQRSVFIICNPVISDQYLTSIIIPKESKESLRKYLKQIGFSQKALFNDIPGLAEANKTNISLERNETLTPEQYRDRGNRAYQEGRYGDALLAYEYYAAALPNIAQPHCLKGDVFTMLGQFEDADMAYTKAIENLDSPISLGENVIVDHELIGNWMRHSLYYNRGNVRAVIGNHREAIEDFDVALEHKLGSKRNILNNRGNSKFSLQMFAEAYQDFESANLEREGSGTALAMGNCKVMTGEFEDALDKYLTGATIESGLSATHCQGNAEQIRQILGLLNGHDFQVRHEGTVMYVDTEHIRGLPSSFPFAGNKGNTGNTPSGLVTAPGGEGYEGMDGFAVIITHTA